MPRYKEYGFVAKRAVKWINANIGNFTLDYDNDRQLIMRLKPLGELALTADLLINYGDALPRIRNEGIKYLNFCWKELRHGDMLCDILRKYPDLAILGVLYPTFTKNGMSNSRFKKIFQSTVHLQGVKAMEYPAWRALELSMTLASLKIKSPWKMRNCFSRTWLYHCPEPWLLGEANAYSLTHTVFYMTNFGRNPAGLPLRYQKYLKLWIPLWAEYYRCIRNYDLLSEFIMSLCCIDAPETESWGKILLDAQQADGMIPGPITDPDSRQRKDQNRLFILNYHTTLVGLIASVMSYDRIQNSEN